MGNLDMMSSVMSENEFGAIREYYRAEAVLERLAEFCGGREFSCEYLVGFGEYLVRQGYQRPIRLADGEGGLRGLTEDGLDVFRSVWDKKATLAIWDVEYFNLDTWADLYLYQLTYFALMEPTYRTISDLLKRYGIPHLNDSTASGYHFISLIPFSSPVHERLEAIGRPEASLREKYVTVPGGDDKRLRPLPEREGRAYSGIGRLMEFVSHEVIRRGQKTSALPIAISDAAQGRSERGRDGMNLDITQYADPLYMRTIRTSFSTHQKHKVYNRRLGAEIARELPVFATLPRNRLSFEELFEFRRDLKKAAEYAAGNHAAIPDASRGWGRVIDDYLASPLYAFHQEFDSVEHDPPQQWPQTYWKLTLDSLPPCAANAVSNPSWGLTIPTSLKHLCRVLYSMGWHSKHIGGLIRSHYEQNSVPDTDWNKYHAETRANFWARVYCGLIATGNDDLSDFNCSSQAEKGFCPSPGCGFNLETFRENIVGQM